MTVVEVHPKKIVGNWSSGIALDLHTISSAPTTEDEFGHMQFDTVRSAIGELLYQLKYRGDQNAADPMIETAAAFLTPHRDRFDLLVPVPASTHRALQPVLVLATGIGKALTLPLAACVTATRQTTQLKAVTDLDKRSELLDGLYAVDKMQTRGKRILLFDDLFRSGSTMNTITNLLLNNGQAKSVCVFTITRTRSKQ